ncbi:mediator of RNA polymerase II transcription subunit 7 [Physcia stellaris]|nr:mediator of RNA polymerase II transcription subunit 7 [Physcia stellaris]
MADQQQSVTISSAFPAPPPFYKHFTTENLARLETIKSSKQPAGEEISLDAPVKSPPPVDITSLPSELRYLIPPSPPTGEYRSFNNIHGTRSTRAEIFEEAQQGINLEHIIPLPPPIEPSSLPSLGALRTLVHRMLLEFLSLTRILSTEPASWVATWNQLRDLFIEAHGIINQYRPHQARESLIEMMEEQIRKGREEIRICGDARSKVKEVLGSLDKVNAEVHVKETEVVYDQRRKRKREALRENEDRRLWSYLEKSLAVPNHNSSS